MLINCYSHPPFSERERGGFGLKNQLLEIACSRPDIDTVLFLFHNKQIISLHYFNFYGIEINLVTFDQFIDCLLFQIVQQLGQRFVDRWKILRTFAEYDNFYSIHQDIKQLCILGTKMLPFLSF